MKIATHVMFVMFAMGISFSHLTAQAQTLCPGTDYQFYEENRLVVMEVEAQPAVGDWVERTDIDGYTGSSYYRWEGSDYFGSPGNGVITYKIRINNPGTYRFTMRSRIAFGNNNTEHNDMWVRFPDADGFFGEKNNGSRVYPKDNGRGPNGDDQTPYPEGSSKDGWFKAYMNRLNAWHWDANTSDNDAHQIYAQFDNSGTYTMQISGRSFGFAIDRLVLFDETLYTEAAIETTSLDQTGCNGGEVNTFDVNNDGIISSSDAVFVINRLGDINSIADVDNSGSVTSTDVNLIIPEIGKQASN